MRALILLGSALGFALGFALAFGLAAEPALGVLYDVDFGTPPHTVGLPPAIGGGPPPRSTVSSIPFGTPTVVASFGLLADQPCRFDSYDAQGDQIQLRLSDLPASTYYALDCEVLVASLAASGTFTFLLDTPQVRSITFTSAGTVNMFVSGFPSQQIGTFAFGSIVLLQVEVDLVANTWTIFLDGTQAHTGPFGGATAVNAVRISTPVTPGPPGASAAIDNLVITEALLNGVAAGNAPPAALRLLEPAPNPARAGTTLGYVLPAGGWASLAIYDVAGREVARLAEGFERAGAHAVRSMDHAAPGVYFLRLSFAGESRVRKLVVVE